MIAFSVVIPTYNRSRQMLQALESLRAQTQPAANFEVVVVVDGSTDDTLLLLEEYATPYALRVIQQKNAGASAARNRGVAEAQGEIILLIDDDIVLTSDVVSEHLQAHQSQRDIVGVGQLVLEPRSDAGWFAQGIVRSWERHYRELNEGRRPPGWRDCYGGNLSVRRDRYLAVGGFPEDIRRTNDIAFALRLVEQGSEVVYLQAAVAHHHEDKTDRQLLRDATAIGRDSAVLALRHSWALPGLLGRFTTISARATMARRVLLNTGLPPALLSAFGPLFELVGWADLWATFVFQYAFWFGVRDVLINQNDELWRQLTHGTAILMYHGFSSAPASRTRYVVSSRNLDCQLTWLRRFGFCFISLSQYVESVTRGVPPPARSLIVTIDDGYEDILSCAEPILRRHGAPATVFLPTAHVGGCNCWDAASELTGRALLSWEQVARLERESILEFGTHTRTHASLRQIDAADVEQEIRGSLQELTTRLVTAVPVLAYPYGHYGPETRSIANRSGLLAACTVEAGLNELATPLHALKRIEVRGTTSWLSLIVAVWLGVDCQK